MIYNNDIQQSDIIYIILAIITFITMVLLFVTFICVCSISQKLIQFNKKINQLLRFFNISIDNDGSEYFETTFTKNMNNNYEMTNNYRTNIKILNQFTRDMINLNKFKWIVVDTTIKDYGIDYWGMYSIEYKNTCIKINSYILNETIHTIIYTKSPNMWKSIYDSYINKINSESLHTIV